MPRHHLALKNFKPSVTEAAVALFDAKPWQLDSCSEEQQAVAQAFADGITTAYGCVPVKVTLSSWSRSTGYTPQDDYYDELAQITMDSWSIYTLMKHVRSHVLTVGAAIPVGDEPSEDPTKWACSLFYAVKPIMFRARVREGRIHGVTAKDTYSSDSWAKLVAADLGDDYDGSLTGTPDQWKAAVEGLPVPVSENAGDSIDDSEEIDVDESDFEAALSDDEQPESDLVAEQVGDTIWVRLGAMSRDQIRALAVANNIPRQGRTKDQLIAALVGAGVEA